MTTALFRDNPYQREATSRVAAITPEGGIVLEETVFYATGGGQPGDSGRIFWSGGDLGVATAVTAGQGGIALVPAEPGALPEIGETVRQTLDWERRHRHMRVHTALHLLSVVLPFGVTGGSIASTHGRLDFDMADAPQDRSAIEEQLNALVARDLKVGEQWITEDELDANPGLVKTMAVQPPRGTGRIRLVRIGETDEPLDLQPCGGTHVARLGEIGSLRLGKIEKKGRMNRRVYLHLDG